jgi:GNAT superfamily N-acetyltransferase
MNFNISQDIFQKHLYKLAISKEYQYKFLRHELYKAIQGESKIYNDSILNIQDDGWILIIHSGALLVYGDNWKINQFEELKITFDLTKFTNYLMTGESSLIYSLLEFYKVTNYKVEMERVFYRTSYVNSFIANNLNVVTANENDTNFLAAMLKQYYFEEYEGENDKQIEEMVLKVQKSIAEGTMYVLKNSEDNILAFCTIINPDIGILFTNTEFRNKGYGKVLLSYCSDILLAKNKEIYLMSVKSRLASNAVFRKVGFVPFYEFSYIRINNSYQR